MMFRNVQLASVAAFAAALSCVYGVESYIPTDGLELHVDAAAESTMTKGPYGYGYNDEQHVTEWRSDVGSLKFTTSLYDSPLYIQSAFGAGRPGLRFGSFDDGTARSQFMAIGANVTNRTVVYVIKNISAVNCMEIFGCPGRDFGIRFNANGQHYHDGLNDGGWGVANGYAWQTPEGAVNYPAAEDPLCFDTQVCVDVAPSSMADIEPVKKDVGYGVDPAGTVFKSRIGYYDGIGGPTYGTRYFRGYFGEILVYNRVLSDDERNALTLGLMRKWCPEKICTWIGGASGNWSDSTNWANGNIPAEDSFVLFENQTVQVSGTAKAGLLVLSGSTLKVAPRSTLTVNSIYRVDGEASQVIYEDMIPYYMPKAGLQFRMDATDEESITYDPSTKQVSVWESNYGPRKFSSGNKKPHYVADIFGIDKPGIQFGYGDDLTTEDESGAWDMRKLFMDRSTTNRTIVYVVKTLKSVNCMEVIGAYGFDFGVRFNSDGSHYKDGFNNGGWGFVNGYNWLTPTVSSAYPASGNPLCFDTQVCVDVCPDSATDTPVSEAASTETVFTVGIGHYDGIGGPTYGQRFYRGYFGEVLAYDRKLADSERDVLVAKLMQKWCPDKVCTWIGGASGSWSDSANWSGGQVPGGQSVVVFSNQTVTVSDTASASVLMLEDGSHVTIASGSVLAATSVCSPNGDDSVIDYAGDAVYNIPQGGHVTISVPPTGATRLVMRGGGTLSFASDNLINGIPIIQEGGIIDLNGTRQTFTSILTDYGIVTNSASTRATMVVTAAADTTSDIQSPIWGDITVEKTGAGTVKLPSLSSVDGETVLSSGMLVHDSAFIPADLISGIGVHVDASRPETLVTNESGYVSKWYDVGGRKIGNYDMWLQQSTTSAQPYYDASVANGKGGVCFGQDADGVNPRITHIDARLDISNVVVMIVMTTASNQRCGELQNGSLPGCFGKLASENGIRLSGSNDTGWKFLGGNGYFTGYDNAGKCGQYLIDGCKVVDGKADMNADVDAPLDRISLLTAVVAPEKLAKTDARWTAYFAPAFGQYYNVYPRFRTGIIHEAIIFTRYLSTDELNAVQAGLMKKWSITPKAVMTVTNSFTSSKLTVKGNSTLDLSSAPQSSIPVVKFDAGGANAYPVLSVLGD